MVLEHDFAYLKYSLPILKIIYKYFMHPNDMTRQLRKLIYIFYTLLRFTIYMTQRKPSNKKNISNQIKEIINDKIIEQQPHYLIKWNSSKWDTWEPEHLIPSKLIQEYIKNKKASAALPQSKTRSKFKRASEIISIQDSSSRTRKIQKKNVPKKKKISKKHIVSRRKHEQQSEDDEEKEKDSFMDEPSHQENINLAEQQKKIKDKSMEQVNCYQNIQDVELIAEIQSDNSSQKWDDRSNMHSRMKQSKMKRMKTSKHKTKTIAKPNRDSNQGLDEDNIIGSRIRKTEKKNYKQENQKKVVPEKSSLNFANIVRDVEKAQYIQDLLICSVLESGMSGPYKYYLVRLKNGDNVYIRQKDMRLYFPRKLHEFYQRILNKVAKSTKQLNFAL